MEAEDHTLNVDGSTMRQIRELTEMVDEITSMAVAAAVERDYDLTIQARKLFKEITTKEREILANLPEMENEDLLQVREVLVSLQETAQYAMRNAEIAANLALNEESEHTTIN